MVAERGVASYSLAVEGPLQFIRRCHLGVAGRRRQSLEGLTVERMHREVDAEPLLGAFDEVFAECGADVDIGEAFAVLHDRRNTEHAELLASRFDADDLLAARERLHDSDA